jgi:cytochrome P450
MDGQAGPDPQSIEYRRCAEPRAYFAGLRALGPVDTAEGFEGRVQVLTLAEGDRMLHDYELFSSEVAGAQPGRPRMIPLQIDPPQHSRYRKLLDPVFAPRSVALLEPDVTSATNDLIDRFYEKGECDFSEELSVPLPSAIFLRLFGLPIEGLDDFLTLKNNIMRAPGQTEQERAAVRGLAARQVRDLFSTVIDERSRQPRDDLITRLINFEVDGDKLTKEEALDICALLLLAGLDTVSISLQCMLYHLATHPAHRQILARDPALAPKVAEELLRWETPVQGVTRVSTRKTEVGGCPFPAGTQFQVLLASINTDPGTVPGYDRLDLTRGDKRHFAFGGGVHRCLGSHLARLELRTVLREWHRRIPEYAVKPGAEIRWNGAMLRGIDHLPLVWEVR